MLEKVGVSLTPCRCSAAWTEVTAFRQVARNRRCLYCLIDDDWNEMYSATYVTVCELQVRYVRCIQHSLAPPTPGT